MLDILFKEKEENYNEILYDVGNKNIHTDTLSFFLKKVLESDVYNKTVKIINTKGNEDINAVIIFLTSLYATKYNQKTILFVLNDYHEMKNIMSYIKMVLNFENLYITIFGHRFFKFNTGQKVYFSFLKTNDDISYLMEGPKYDFIIYSNLDLYDPEVILNYSKIKKAFNSNKRIDTLQISFNNFKYSHNV